MFVPLFVGLYKSLFGFRVLGTLWVYSKARDRTFDLPASSSDNPKKLDLKGY